MAKPPKIPRLTVKRIRDAVVDLPARMRALEADAEDRRRLRGKYAPTPGRCRVCSGEVVADIAFPRTGVLGGPPTQAYVSGWHCEDCKLVYWSVPPPKESP